ncbi:dynein regulatory complex protein 1-like [Oopsacas minuta]|uniref:Dynein regulatory complex protein 1-like n=1 Tax=Oopsacas minuta TaxID=111878 RepID=A0AAV7K8E8_9METZ|nr:dynein regulatory complex protein 1-like [Oopsacas minuta]
METIGEVGETSEVLGQQTNRSSVKRSDKESQDSSRKRLSPELSIFSENKEERIRARRLRIKRRLEEERRKANKEDGDIGAEMEESPKQERISIKQVEKSKFELQRLNYENNQLVRDVIIAGDGREMARRRGEDDNLRTRTEKLEAEANTGKERFDEIAKRWESSAMKKLPQELQDMLNQQRSEYEEMINEKNRLIKEFESELKIKDDQYVKDLKQQAGDVDLLLERMEDQTRTLARAYNKEMREIENTYIRERKQLLENECSEDTNITEERCKLELTYMQDYQKLVEDSDRQLDELLSNGDEDYRNTKIQLENDIQFLQRQLEQMKATFHLNIEKLDYNLQVVKKRDEENKKTENQQKRKISRLQDQYNSQRSRLKQQELKFSTEVSSLGEEYQKVADQLGDLQLKLSHFQETDEKKFADVWAMSEEEIQGLVKDVLKTDEIIHSHQLGVDWTSPELPESVHYVHIPEQVMSATQIAQEVFSTTSASSSQQSLLSVYEMRQIGPDSGGLDTGLFGVGQLGEYPTLLLRYQYN